MTTRLPASIKVDISMILVFKKKSNNKRLKWFNAPRAYIHLKMFYGLFVNVFYYEVSLSLAGL